jgi:hypothetical protein
VVHFTPLSPSAERRHSAARAFAIINFLAKSYTTFVGLLLISGPRVKGVTILLDDETAGWVRLFAAHDRGRRR